MGQHVSCARKQIVKAGQIHIVKLTFAPFSLRQCPVFSPAVAASLPPPMLPPAVLLCLTPVFFVCKCKCYPDTLAPDVHVSQQCSTNKKRPSALRMAVGAQCIAWHPVPHLSRHDAPLPFRGGLLPRELATVVYVDEESVPVNAATHPPTQVSTTQWDHASGIGPPTVACLVRDARPVSASATHNCSCKSMTHSQSTDQAGGTSELCDTGPPHLGSRPPCMAPMGTKSGRRVYHGSSSPPPAAPASASRLVPCGSADAPPSPLGALPGIGSAVRRRRGGGSSDGSSAVRSIPSDLKSDPSGAAVSDVRLAGWLGG